VAARRTLPGFGLSMGFTLLYVCLIVLIPLSTIFVRSSTLSFGQLWSVVTAPRTLAAYRLSFAAALSAAAINLVFGVLVAWVLERYSFPLKRVVDGLVDLPFALPTAVAGIALATVYAPDGWIGRFAAAIGLKIAFTPLGVVVALVFVGLPFVQPVLHDLDPELEEAAASLGAGRAATFVRVILPEILPAALTGFVVAFARGLGEYGSVIFIAGNIPMVSEITPLLIMIQLEQYDYAGATAIALVFLLASFGVLLAVNGLSRRYGRGPAAVRGA
jgi:sulfate transport system permease protein